MLATLDPGFAGKVQYYQSSTLERIQSVALPKEASDWTRCQEYTRDVVPVNWSARPWRLSCRRGKHLRGLRDAGEQPSCLPRGSLTPSPFFRRRATFAVFDLVMLKVSYGCSFSPSLSFSFVASTRQRLHVVVGPEHLMSSYPRTTTSRSRKSPEGDERETIRRRWFWYPRNGAFRIFHPTRRE